MQPARSPGRLAARQAGISGLAVGLAAAGGLLLYSGINHVPLPDLLRWFLSGQLPTAAGGQSLDQARAGVVEGLAAAEPTTKERKLPGEQPTAAAAGGALGDRVAAAALAHIGAPYVFGAAGPTTFDCSGLVTYCLVQSGVTGLPSMSHTTAIQFYTWGGARTVARQLCAPGDLVCWTGHVGIAVSGTDMVSAPALGQTVHRTGIWGTPAPVIRRPVAYGGV